MQTFRDFMERALYHPESGFYSRRIPTEDFYTAPELHPAFAGVLARDLASRLARLRAEGAGPVRIVEMGGGRGLLAEQLLGELSRLGERVPYALVERAAGPRAQAQARLAGRQARVVASLEELEPGAGVFLSNELVDAFPVHLLEKKDGQVLEVCVDGDGSPVLCPLSRPELQAHAQSVFEHLEEGSRHAVNLEVAGWLDAVCEKLSRGWLLTVDYGKRFGAAPNPPRAFRRHRLEDALLDAPGSKDLTASVDFEALISQGERRGLALERYETLSRFLLDGGVADWLEGADFAQRAKVKTLIHPEAMGETFKVLIQRKSELPS